MTASPSSCSGPGPPALLRSLGADLAAHGTSRKLLRAGSPLLAAAGVAAIAFSQSFGVALAAVVLMAAGFALPYAVIIVAAQRLYPQEPAEPVALLTTVASAAPIALIPLFGIALADGLGEEALLAVAALIALAAALNIAAADEPLVGSPES